MASLPKNEVIYVFDGLSVLAKNIILKSAKSIRRLSRTGVFKLSKSILALQQCISSITLQHEEKIDQARKYFHLFLASAQVLLLPRSPETSIFLRIWLRVSKITDPRIRSRNTRQCLDFTFKISALSSHNGKSTKSSWQS
jgi:hypothetical protein